MSGFERLSVLIVDDNPMVRSVEMAMFQALGTRQIVALQDGKEAVEFIKRVETSPNEAGTSQLDLIITDLIMPCVDGFTLLNWLRNAHAAQDRFLAVMAVSGATHATHVARARDLGVNEIVAKPFTIEQLSTKILHIVNHPRQFVLAPTFFGPDRRRIERPVAADRRMLPLERIQIINAGDGVKEIRHSADVVHIRLRNRLKEKLGSGHDLPPLDPEILRAIAERVKQYVGGHTDWLSKQLSLMQAAANGLARGTNDTARHVELIHTLAMEMRSQAELFDFPLVGEFSNSLYDLTHGYQPDMFSVRYVRLIEAHVQGIQAIIHQHIVGQGGALGDAVRDELMRARNRFGQPAKEAAAV